MRPRPSRSCASLAAIGAGGAACYAAGFSEAGTEEGAAREDALRDAAGAMPVLGPNCYGAIDLVGGGGLWPVPWPHERRERGVAVVLQSGNLGINVTMSQRSLPLAFVASVGNQAVVELAEVVNVYLEMDEVTGIGMYLEGLRDVPRFAAAAARALERGVPLAACKAGVSSLGRDLTLTHTASLAGSDELYDALFERYGVARARSIPELLETLKALVTAGPLRDAGVVFTCSGAESALAADLADVSGSSCPSRRGDEGGARRSPAEFALVSNPSTTTPALWARGAAAARVRAALADPADAALLVIDYPRPGMPYAADVNRAIAAHLVACAEAGVPAAVAARCRSRCSRMRARSCSRAGRSPLQGPVEAFRRARRLRSPRGAPAAGVPAPLVPVSTLAGEASLLDEAASKALVAPFASPSRRRLVPRRRRRPRRRRSASGRGEALQPRAAAQGSCRGGSLGLRDERRSRRPSRRCSPRTLAFHSRACSSSAWSRVLCASCSSELSTISTFGHVLLVGSGGVSRRARRGRAPAAPARRRGRTWRRRSRACGWRRCCAGATWAPRSTPCSLSQGSSNAHRDRLAEIDVNPLLVLERRRRRDGLARL